MHKSHATDASWWNSPLEVRARGVERATRAAVRQPLDFTNDVAVRVECSTSLLASCNPAPA